MSYVMAVDPGKLTGWLVYQPLPVAGPSDMALDIVDWGEDSQQSFCEIAEKWVDKTSIPVVCERWDYRPGVRTFQPYSLEIIGTLRYLTGFNPRRFHLQGPASAKEFGTHAKLHPYIWAGFGKGGAGHAVDALRHALLFESTR
jgi:hypothetical protein